MFATLIMQGSPLFINDPQTGEPIIVLNDGGKLKFFNGNLDLEAKSPDVKVYPSKIDGNDKVTIEGSFIGTHSFYDPAGNLKAKTEQK